MHTLRVENVLLELFSTETFLGREFSPWTLLQVYARLQAVEHTLGGYCHRKRWSRIRWWKSSTSIFRVESFLLELLSTVIRCKISNAFFEFRAFSSNSPRTASAAITCLVAMLCRKGKTHDSDLLGLATRSPCSARNCSVPTRCEENPDGRVGYKTYARARLSKTSAAWCRVMLAYFEFEPGDSNLM